MTQTRKLFPVTPSSSPSTTPSLHAIQSRNRYFFSILFTCLLWIIPFSPHHSLVMDQKEALILYITASFWRQASLLNCVRDQFLFCQLFGVLHLFALSFWNKLQCSFHSSAHRRHLLCALLFLNADATKAVCCTIFSVDWEKNVWKTNLQFHCLPAKHEPSMEWVDFAHIYW